MRIHAAIGFPQDLYLCLCYLPPENSTYYSSLAEHPLDVITREAHSAAALGSVLLAGDFNSRTGTTPDWTTTADLAELQEFIPGLPTILDSASPPPRQNKDPKSNRQGKVFLEMCQECQLILANGRTRGDLHGKVTCYNSNKGASTVDYFVADREFWKTTISNLHVHECPPALGGRPLSDHCPLELTLRRQPIAGSQNPPTPPPQHIPRFVYNPVPDTLKSYCVALGGDPLLAPAYLNSLKPAAAAEMLQQRIMHHISSTYPSLNPPQSHNHNKHKHQPWFDADCKLARRRLRTIARLDPSSHAAVQARRDFRRLAARKKKLWNEARLARLVEDARHSPAAFWRQYRKKGKTIKLVSAVQWFTYCQKLFSPPSKRTATPPPLPPLPPETAAQWAVAAEELNAHITASEVEACLDRLRRNKAAGFDGMRAEFLLDAAPTTDPTNPGGPRAPHPLATPLAIVFDKIFFSQFPSPWNTQIIHPIFKDGDELDPNNYRCISVGPVFAKLYAMVLEARISKWAETQGVRAVGQAGFRHDYRTTDHIFTLQTLVEKAKANKTDLYCCFVDFRKAFDSVPRDLLWQRLGEAGLGGEMLAALKSLYAEVRARVATLDGLTDPFDCSLGVKQGCPLSPLLFGLYIDRLEPLIAACNGAPPTLNGTPVPLLLYADDLLLISSNPAGLQRQLDSLHTFCTASELDVNLTKTQIVICAGGRRSAARTPVWHLGGERVSVVMQYKYLGLTFEGSHGFSRCVERLAASGQKALHALYARCHELHLEIPSLMCALFDSLVRPILSYACEVWACLPGTAALREQCEVVHRRFLKRCMGVAQATPNDVVYGEFGRPPLQVFWSELMKRYLERLEGAADGSLLACAFQESAALHAAGSSSWVGWARQQQAATEAQPWVAGWLQRLSSGESGSKIRSYAAFKTGWGLEPYLSEIDIPRQHRVALARLRSGSHWLGSQLGIYAKAAERQRERRIPCVQCSLTRPFVDNPMLLCDACDAGWHLLCLDDAHAMLAPPQDSWFCPSCASVGDCSPIALVARTARIESAQSCPFCGQKEDEWHALFSCGMYNSIRDAFPDLFSSPQSTTLYGFFDDNRGKISQLCEFVHLCYRKRQASA